MERSILSPDFKGGIWHRFFAAADKKDETLKSILDEKIRFYKLYYPFLKKKQIIGKAYEELGIPHICGEVNRKELYKLFLQKRKKQATTGKRSRDSSHKYPKLLIEINPRNKSSLKKPVVPSKPKKLQVKVNKEQSKTEKTQQDITFNKLLFEGTNKKDLKERKFQDMYSKQPKSVRFNEGIEIYRVSPARPMYKLKPIGRLFDEPSSVRTLNTQQINHNYHTEVQEDTFDSDSEFDADTGIISDPEGSDLEDSSQIRLFPYEELPSKNTEIIGANVEEICSQKTETTTIYSCSDEEVYSTDSDMAKKGNNLILSSKMITVAQGKWVRKTEKIIENTNQIKILQTPNTSENENVYQYSEVESEIHIDKNDTIDDHLIERIKGLYLSNTPENKHKNSKVLSSEDNHNIEEVRMKVEKEKLITETLEVEQRTDNKEIGNISLNPISNEISSNIKSKNTNILLENDFNKNLINKALITVNVNKHSYAFNEVSKTNIHTENNSEKEIKTIHDKIIHDNSNIINDWDSTDQSDEPTGIELKYTDKNIIANQDSNKKLKSMKPQNKNKILAEEKYLFDAKPSAVKNDNLNNSLDEESGTKPSDTLCSVKNTDISLKRTLLTNNKLDSLNSDEVNHKLDDIKPKAGSSYEDKITDTEQPSGFKEPQEVNGSFITPNAINVNTSFTIKNERLKQKEIEGILTSKASTENSSISNLKEPSFNNYSFVTTAIKPQSQKSKGEDYKNDGHKSSQLSNDLELHKDETKSIPTCHVVSKLMVDKMDDNFEHLEKLDITNLKNLTVNTDAKILADENMPKSSKAIGSQSRENVIEDGSISIKPLITDQNLQYEGTESELCDLEAENIYQGYYSIKSEPGTLDYLSKVHMWSLYSKNYIEDFTASESMSVKTTINPNSAHREISETSEESTKNSNHEICKLETHLSFKDIESSKRLEHQQVSVCESSFESPDEKMVERGSSYGTVTPINIEHNNSNEVSTAYETDPETGKLKMNRSFRPLAGSTPVVKPKGKYKEEYFHGNQPDKSSNSSRESPTNISFEYANKMEDKHSMQDKDDSSSTKGTLKSVCQNHSQNYPQSQNLEPNISPNLTITSQYFKKTEMSGSQKINVKNEKSNIIYNNCEINKNDLNNFGDPITENYFNNHNATSRSTALITYHEDDNNKTSNKSIIESRDHKVFRNLKNDKNIKNLGSIICFKTQQDDECNNSKNFIENNDSKIYDKLIDIKHEGNTPIVSETGTSITEPTGNSNKTANESMIDNSDSKSKNISPICLNSYPNLVTNSGVHENSELKRPLSYQKLEKKTIYSFENSHVSSFIRNSNLQQICESNKGSEIPQFMYQCPYNDRTQNTKSQNNLSTNSNVISFVSASVETKTDTDNYNIYKSKVSQNDDSESPKLQDTKHTTISDCIAAGLPSISDLQVLSSVSPKIVRRNYLRSKRDSSSMKRKFKTSYEKYHGFGYSLSSEDENFELLQNVSSSSCTIQSTAGGNSKSSSATQTDIVKMNVKRVNTDIRKKRAKLIKENPVKRGNTSSSEDEVKKSSLPLKKKRSDINRPLVDSSLESQIIVNPLPKELVPENNYSHVKEKITRPKSREDGTDQEEDMVSRNFPVSSEDKVRHDRSGLGASRTINSEDTKLELPQGIELHQSTKSIGQTKDGHRKYDKKMTDLSYLPLKANSSLDKNLNIPLVSSPNQTISQTEKKQTTNDGLQDQVVTNPIVILNTTRKSHLSSQLLTTELPLSVNTKLNDSLRKRSASAIDVKRVNSNNYNSDFSASSNSIIGPSPNTDREENEICKVNVSSIHNEIKPQCTYLKTTSMRSDAKRKINRSENQSNWVMKRKQIKEKARHLSDQFAYTHNKKSEKSNVSYWLYRKGEGDKNKENLAFKDSNDPANKFPRTPLGVIKGKPDNESNSIETKNIDSQDANPDNLSVQSKVKNTKSSIVSWVGTTEADRMANSPEVRTLLRRTYFMGKNN